MAEDKSARRFRIALLLYALLLILLCAAALFLLQRFLAVYELTRPAAALSAYREALLDEGSTPGLRAALAPLDPELRTEEESLALAVEALREAAFEEIPAESTETEKHYRVRAGGETLGQFVLRQTGKERFGLRGWEAAEDRYDLSSLMHSFSVTAPPDHQVFLGDHLLGEREISERDIPYEALGEAYSMIEGLPRLLRYSSGLYLGELPVRILDGSGQELPLERQEELSYLDSCGAEKRAELEDFIERFLRPYVLFTAKIGQADAVYFEQILPMTAPGSALRRRLEEGVANTWWSWIQSCELTDTGIRFCTDLGEGRYLVDLNYTTRVVAYADPVTASYSLRILLDESTGRLLAVALYNY